MRVLGLQMKQNPPGTASFPGAGVRRGRGQLILWWDARGTLEGAAGGGRGGGRCLLAVWRRVSANEPLSAGEGDFLRWASLGEGTAALALEHVPLTPGSPGLQLRPRVIPGYGLPLKSEDGAKSGREQRAVWVPLGFILRDGGAVAGEEEAAVGAEEPARSVAMVTSPI